MKPNPDLCRRFARVMAERQLPQSSRAIMLAVSGGADSLGLVALIQSWRHALAASHHQNDIPLVRAIIIDHGLRAEAAAEAKYVENMLVSAGITARRVAIPDKPPTHGVSEWARQHRYQCLTAEAMKHDAVLMTAHHLDDQLETVEMRLAKGSGLRGLAAMKLETGYLGVRLIRPCLNFTKSELAEAAEAAGFTPVVDPTNLDERYQRPRLRADRHARAKSGVSDQQLAKLSQLSSRLIKQIDVAVKATSPSQFSIHPLGFAAMAKDVISMQGFTLIASHILRHMSVKPYPVSDQALAILRDRLHAGGEATLGGCEWRWHTQNPDQIIICREPEANIPAINLPSGQGVFDNRWRISYPHSVQVEAIGAERFAKIRTILSDVQDWPQVMARIFWSLPVLIDTDTKNLDVKHGLDLDEGFIFPHLKDIDIVYDSNNKPDMLEKRFYGARFYGARFLWA